MLHTTRWFPDTCSCQIDYEWDDALDADTVAYSLVDAVKCPFHLNEVDVLKTVTRENTFKNRVLGMIQERNPAMDISGIAFEYDANRHLTIHLPDSRRLASILPAEVRLLDA